jgi:hypothetical protein
MQYLGTSFSLVLGAWRLRLQVAVEDALEPESAPRAASDSAAAHHLTLIDGEPTLGRSGRGRRP